MSLVSYGMGLAMGAFMNLHTIDTIDYGVFRSTRSQFKISSLDYVKKVRSSGRGFAAFGIIYAVLELCLEKVRPRADGPNSFVAGGLCTLVLALDSGMGPKGLFNTFLFGAVFAFGMEELMADKMG